MKILTSQNTMFIDSDYTAVCLFEDNREAYLSFLRNAISRRVVGYMITQED